MIFLCVIGNNQGSGIMEFFPDFTSMEGMASIIFFLTGTVILQSKISTMFLIDSDSAIKRFFVYLSAGFGIGALIASFGVILALLDLISMSSYWNTLTTFMALFSISFRDMFRLVSKN